ncbi:MAG: hypothetical protein NTV43_07505 [Methylococcales bacterium]|nr:hypothetical protein [Methylococcales bacterium]
MTETMMNIKIAYILQIVGDQVQTDRNGTLNCTNADFLNDLSFYSSRKIPVTLSFDETNRSIQSVSSAPVDALIVLSQKESPETQITVQLLKRPTLLYLNKSNPRFNELYEQLYQALIEKKQVLIGILPGSNQVEDVRIEKE